jgi:arsenical pump membrane protein
VIASGPVVATWAIIACAIAAIVVRPLAWPEAVWAMAGAALLVVFGLVPAREALAAIGEGTDVYLFLVGMMLLSETARREGLFDWVAVVAVNGARGSPRRLFALVYVVGVVITTFLSNDATAVVLTPAVYAVARRAQVKPLPYLFVCAFVANAASFVLPIANPANIVLYGDHAPPLADWLARFAWPSVAAIAATYVGLRVTAARRLEGSCARGLAVEPLSRGARVALAGIVLTAVALSVISALDRPLGLPTALLGIATTIAVIAVSRRSPWPVLRDVSWSVLFLVAGLFVLVRGLARTGVVDRLADALRTIIQTGVGEAAWTSGAAIAFVSNVVNNLPAGLVAHSVVQAVAPPQVVLDALLIGVDLGPNLSITGSLATILWLTAIRREGESVGFWRFLAVGVVVMPVALVLALAARVALG